MLWTLLFDGRARAAIRRTRARQTSVEARKLEEGRAHRQLDGGMEENARDDVGCGELTPQQREVLAALECEGAAGEQYIKRVLHRQPDAQRAAKRQVLDMGGVRKGVPVHPVHSPMQDLADESR